MLRSAKALPLRVVAFFQGLMIVIFAYSLLSSVSHAQTPGAKVKSIEIRGNVRIERAAILGAMKTKIDSAFDPSWPSEDLKAIYQMDYFDDVQLKARQEGEDLVLIVVVQERPSIMKIRFEGNEEIKEDELKGLIKTVQYSLLDMHKIREDAEKIIQKYAEKGYFLAHVEPKLKEKPENQRELTFVITENKPLTIKRINFLGNHAFSEAELKANIETKEGGLMSMFPGLGGGSGSFKEEIFNIDKQRLLFHYLKNGYINVKISEPQVYLTPDKRWLYLTIPIDEGEQYTIASIDFSGDLLFAKEKLFDKLTIKTGERFDYERVQKDIQEITTLYQDKGYAFPNIIPNYQQDKDKRTVDLNLTIQKGKLTYIERIDIAGNVTTRDKIIRRLIFLAEGELYNASKLKDSEFNLRSLGFFKEVKISHKAGSSDEQLILTVDVTEESTGTFTIGAAFNTLENFQFISQIQKTNLFGYGWTINLSARLGGRSRIFNLNFVEPYLFDTDLQLSVNAFNQENRFTDFSTKRSGGGATFTYPIYRPYYRASVGYNLEDVAIADVTEFQKRLFQDGVTSSVLFSVYHDSRIRVSMFQAVSGFLSSASAEYAGTFLGGDNSYVEYGLKHIQHIPVFGGTFPLFGGSQIEFRGRLRYLQSVTGDPVPLYIRYFPGGINSMRGFVFRSLGPYIDVANTADPHSFVRRQFKIGGNKELVTNLEYIMPLFREQNILLVTFLDVGNAFNNGEMLSPLQLRQSTGFGVRWYSPIGPLRFEWGFPFNRRQDEQSMVFEFSIGTPF